MPISKEDFLMIKNFTEYRENKSRLIKEIRKKCSSINDVVANTEYVLLHKENGEVKLGAYVNNKEKQFFFPAFKEWQFDVKGVHKFRICVNENGHFIPVREENIMEETDFTDFYVLISRKDGDKCFIELYHKNEIAFSVKTADTWFKCGIDLKIIYTTEKDGIFTYWVYREGKHNELSDSKDRWFSQTGYFEENKRLPNIIDGDFVELFFHYVNCKRFYIAEYFARNNGDYFSLIPKQFEDDDTCNYVVKFQKNRYEDIAFMNYCVQSEIGGYSVYGFPVHELKNGCIRTKNGDSLYIELSLIWESIEYELQRREILKHIYQMMNIEEDLSYVPKLQYSDRTPAQSTAVLEYLREKYKLLDREDYQAYKEKYNAIYDKLVQSGIVQVKWKSEYELYKTVKRKYPDAIYQHRDRWLGMQSLDIYIPSLKIGLEYQGEQHYRPISLFGGEEQFEHRKILDETKKSLCKENGVRLIEWKYDENISVVLLGKKIKEALEK